MPVVLNVIETTVELGQTNVEVILESASEPGPAGPGVPTGGTINQVLTKDSATDFDTSWQDAQGGAGGAPTDADYLVGTAHGDLSAEIVVGTTPGGELGGTWASPTVDATHSGSSHAGVQAAAEATAAAALTAHEADTTAVHGIANTANLYSVGGTDVAIADGGTGASTAAGARANLDLEAGTDFPSLATFNDHSARHEDGGADEITIQGLAGTPVELTNHLNDAADAHDASAISFTPAGTIAATDVQAAIEEVAAEAGGGTGEALQRSISQTGHGLAVGDVVIHDGTDFIKAQGNSAANSEVVGIVSAVADVNTFTLHYGGRVTGLSGLTAGETYFLDDDTAGLLTTTEPSDAGDVSKPLLIADSTTTGYFFNWRGVVVADMATQAELDAHINDSSDAHDASAISVLDTGGDYTATDVEGVLAEIAPQLGGGATDPVFDLFGTPDTAFEFDTSSLSGLTALSPTPDVVNADTTVPGCYFIRDDAVSFSVCGHYVNGLTPPFTVIACLIDTNIQTDFGQVGVFVGESTPGVMENEAIGRNSGNVPVTSRFTNPTTFGSAITTGVGTALVAQPPFWLAIRATLSTNVTYLFSVNGRVWRAQTSARNPSITIASAGIYLVGNNSGVVAGAFDYLRIWNSALTFPGVP